MIELPVLVNDGAERSENTDGKNVAPVDCSQGPKAAHAPLELKSPWFIWAPMSVDLHSIIMLRTQLWTMAWEVTKLKHRFSRSALTRLGHIRRRQHTGR